MWQQSPTKSKSSAQKGQLNSARDSSSSPSTSSNPRYKSRVPKPPIKRFKPHRSTNRSQTKQKGGERIRGLSPYRDWRRRFEAAAERRLHESASMDRSIDLDRYRAKLRFDAIGFDCSAKETLAREPTLVAIKLLRRIVSKNYSNYYYLL